MQKLGVLCGTFDPIHEGHIALAKETLRQGGLDQVILLPIARPIHRESDVSAADRLRMCQISVEGEDKITVSLAGMASGVRSYPDVLVPLQRDFPHTDFTFILGADQLPLLPYWDQSNKLFSKCSFLCFSRSGVSTAVSLDKALASGAKITLLPSFQSPYSAAMIRAQTAQYMDAPGVNRKVLCYMAERGLYQRDFLPKLRNMMNPHRFEHTLGVRSEAIRLADIHGLPVQKAALAALLHDCAKGMNLKDMRKIAIEQHLTDDETILSSSALLHAPVGAYLAQKEFGIRDADVLNAIRSHTVGRSGMSRLEMCIFVADATEAGREEYEGLSELRRLSSLSLPAAVYRSLQLTQEYIMKTNRTFNPSSYNTMAYLETLMTAEEKKLLADNQ